MIDGKTKILGLIGSDIEHSLSYCMHNYAASNRSINAVYVPISTPQDNLDAAISILRSPSFLGANITQPHKKEILPFLDRIDPIAERIGAVNTVIKDENGMLIGKNSDVFGFLSALKESRFPYTDKDVLRLGAGGAAYAVTDALSGMGTRSIYVYNRTAAKAIALIEHFQSYYPNQSYVLCTNPHELIIPLLIVNATPLGTPNTSLAQAFPPHPTLKPSDSLIDLVYHPTPLVQKASQKCLVSADGQSMLLHQAALSFSWWFQTSAPIREMRTALQTHLDFWNAS